MKSVALGEAYSLFSATALRTAIEAGALRVDVRERDGVAALASRTAAVAAVMLTTRRCRARATTEQARDNHD